jgi:hypothetical protein
MAFNTVLCLALSGFLFSPLQMLLNFVGIERERGGGCRSMNGRARMKKKEGEKKAENNIGTTPEGLQ